MGKAVTLDVETDALYNPTVIHVICTCDVETGELHEWYGGQWGLLRSYLSTFDHVVGHNIIGYDWRVCEELIEPGFLDVDRIVDTLILSRLVDYKRDGGHSLEAWGETLGESKHGANISDFSTLTPELLERCKSDVRINAKLYHKLWQVAGTNAYSNAVAIEHRMAFIALDMGINGFSYNRSAADLLFSELSQKVERLDAHIRAAFPPRTVELRKITPKLTKHGTINKQDFRWYKEQDYSIFEAGAEFCTFEWEEFNPASPTQVVERLNKEGWKPYEKTNGHIDAERAKDKEAIERYRVYGWKVSENNLATLPDTASVGARSLVERLLLNSRLTTLKSWREAYNETDGRIHGQFIPLGTWTQRAAHRNPNMGNIATEKSIKYKSEALAKLAVYYGGKMRALWTASDGNWLVGCDAASIQLRVLAHYMEDDRFTFAVTQGKSDNETDPHSLNKKALGEFCGSRDTAKTFIYAWLLGAGTGKIAEILGCSKRNAKASVQKFVEFYPGLAKLRDEVIPADAARGYFQGFDGRPVFCDSEHHMLAGYLQNGETLIMRYANALWRTRAREAGIWFKQVNWVHDEWQTEVRTEQDGHDLGRLQARAIVDAGVLLGVKCPQAGEYKVGRTWHDTH